MIIHIKKIFTNYRSNKRLKATQSDSKRLNCYTNNGSYQGHYYRVLQPCRR